MIVEAILQTFMKIIGYFIGSVYTVIGSPPDGAFIKIPVLFWDMFQTILTQTTALYVPLLAWWVWRQIKA